MRGVIEFMFPFCGSWVLAGQREQGSFPKVHGVGAAKASQAPELEKRPGEELQGRRACPEAT